jgi:hypothetical protein
MRTLKEIQDYCRDKTVIFVGNSKKILKHERADFIESHDIVLRFNLGFPRKKYYKHIGRRTDIWSNNGLSPDNEVQLKYFRKYDYPEYILLPTVRCEGYTPEEIEKVAYRFSFNIYFDIFKFMNPDIEDHRKALFKFSEDMTQTIPTSGSLVLSFFCKHIECKSITMIGFDFLKTQNFYVRNRDHTPRHHSNKEEEFILSLVKTRPYINLLPE